MNKNGIQNLDFITLCAREGLYSLEPRARLEFVHSCPGPQSFYHSYSTACTGEASWLSKCSHFFPCLISLFDAPNFAQYLFHKCACLYSKKLCLLSVDRLASMLVQYSMCNSTLVCRGGESYQGLGNYKKGKAPCLVEIESLMCQKNHTVQFYRL